MRHDVSENTENQMNVISSLLTYAELRVNFPLVWRVCSCLPDSIPNRATYPQRLPEVINLSSGEKAIVHISTRPTSMLPTFPQLQDPTLRGLSPVNLKHKLKSWNLHCYGM